MTPSISTGITTAFAEFADPQRRPQILKWHQEEMPFLDMAKALGIEFDQPLSDAIAGLTADQVKTIRTAMVAALESDGTEMPIDCKLNELPASIVVSPEDRAGKPWARVTAGK